MGGGGGRRGGGPTALADGPPPARPPGLRAGSRRRLASTRGGDAMPVASSGAALRARRVGPGPGEVSAGAGRRRPEMSGLPGKAAPAGPGVGGVGGCGRRPVRPVAGMVAVGWRVAGPGWLSAGRGVGCRTVQTGGPTKKRRVVVVKKKKAAARLSTSRSLAPFSHTRPARLCRRLPRLSPGPSNPHTVISPACADSAENSSYFTSKKTIPLLVLLSLSLLNLLATERARLAHGQRLRRAGRVVPVPAR